MHDPPEGWLATSRYSNRQGILESGRAPTGITLGNPRWKLGYELAGRVRLLAPSRAIFRLDGDPFVAGYRDQLNEIGVDAVAAALRAVETDAEGLVLLCFERVAAPDLELCHRRVFADWWQERTGIEVPELPDHTASKVKGQRRPEPAGLF